MNEASQLIREHLEYLVSDFSKWRSLFAEDAVMQFIYGPSAEVPEMEYGIEQIAAHVGGFLKSVEHLQLRNAVIHPIADRNEAIAEFEGEAVVIATQRRYAQKYLIFVRAEAGKIIYFREYFDPVRVLNAFSDDAPTNASANSESPES